MADPIRMQKSAFLELADLVAPMPQQLLVYQALRAPRPCDSTVKFLVKGHLRFAPGRKRKDVTEMAMCTGRHGPARGGCVGWLCGMTSAQHNGIDDAVT